MQAEATEEGQLKAVGAWSRVGVVKGFRFRALRLLCKMSWDDGFGAQSVWSRGLGFSVVGF